MAVPRLDKISVNIGMGEATQNAKLIDGAVNELGQIAGQKPVATKARNGFETSISAPHKADKAFQVVALDAQGRKLGTSKTITG